MGVLTQVLVEVQAGRVEQQRRDERLRRLFALLGTTSVLGTLGALVGLLVAFKNLWGK